MKKEPLVKDLMVPLSDYATVSRQANLKQALAALNRADKNYGDRPYRHRSVLVLDENGEVVGKLSQVDIMRAIEPNYNQLGADIGLDRFGFSAKFMRSIQDQYGLWKRPLDEMGQLMDRVRVEDVMYHPADHQRVRENDVLTTAIHQIVMGRHQSLLVLRGKHIVGILRSTDVFNALSDLLGE